MSSPRPASVLARAALDCPRRDAEPHAELLEAEGVHGIHPLVERADLDPLVLRRPMPPRPEPVERITGPAAALLGKDRRPVLAVVCPALLAALLGVAPTPGAL